ncbi:hypothetical protein N8I71_00695 [Roseibacterium sp. SDUM158016]|uniref:hypothetical protein n=1 Tax=Roseicyclus sediminis TaxID=2980997 RepID=UPI0021D05727|nr:hypothetical protein [Roseibacterium sp. SDUM158016]MCU4651333.1 hypothetical protein [Roseibacterium sp. SDUM158016]
MAAVLIEALPVALVAGALFAGLALMTNRPRGAALAQGALVLAAALIFAAIVIGGDVLGLPGQRVGGFGVGLLAAAASGMLYHLYLGRFENVWAARVVFTLVFLAASALFGLVILPLI